MVNTAGDSAINYIKIFQNSKAYEILVGNIYTEYLLIHTFLYNLQKDRKYSSHIVIRKE